MFFAPIPEKGISDFIAHGSIIQVFTVAVEMLPAAEGRAFFSLWAMSYRSRELPLTEVTGGYVGESPQSE